MNCPKCGCDSSVFDTRRHTDRIRRRRRECKKCGYYFTTYEFVVSNKKDKELKEKYKEINNE